MPSEFDHPKSLRVLFPIIKGIATAIFWFFAAPIFTKNRRSIPQSGSLLIISNHISNTDPIVVQYASSRLVHFLARKELFSMGLLGKFVTWWRGIPIKQSSADKGAIKKAIEMLKSDAVVGIFPEGQLSPDGRLIELFEGTALIIRLAECPCICVGLKGSNKLMPHPSVIPRWSFRKIEARWGEPRTFTKSASTEDIMGWIESELKSLSDQE